MTSPRIIITILYFGISLKEEFKKKLETEYLVLHKNINTNCSASRERLLKNNHAFSWCRFSDIQVMMK